MEDRILQRLLAHPATAPLPAPREEDCDHPIVLDLSSESVGDPLAPARERDAAADPAGAAFLLDAGEDEALLVTGATLSRLPRGGGGEELWARAVAGARAWRYERIRTWKEQQLARELISFSTQLNAARSTAAVFEALRGCAVRTVGAYVAFLFVPDGPGRLHLADGPPLPGIPAGLSAPARARFRQPGIVRAPEARPGTGAPLSELAPLFTATGAAFLSHVPLGEEGVLVLAERRGERVMEARDWELLRTLTQQAGVALERVHLFAQVRELSLTDPLTGLANRRHMDVVLARKWGAARRGEALSLVMIDLDWFKAVNDRCGHLEGDRILRQVAACLREVIRDADLAVRFGGDEFLLILPGTELSGASALIQRIRESLPDEIGISAGAAQYAPEMQDAEELVRAADRALYAEKRLRKGAPPS